MFPSHDLEGVTQAAQRRVDLTKRLIIDGVKKFGSVETEFVSIKVSTIKTTSVKITDYDLCMKLYPEAVQMHTEDNVRKITLLKDALKEKASDGDITPGFELVERQTERLHVSIKGRHNEIAEK